MSTTPPDLPFGDPTAIQKQNRSAVGKGVGIACGGCAALLLLAMLAGAAIFFFVIKTMSNSDAVTQSFARVQASPVVREKLGSPLEKEWLVTGSISINNGSGTADINVPVKGPKGGGTMKAVATCVPGGPWMYSVLTLTVAGTGEVIDLTQAEQPPAAEAPGK